MKGGLGFSLYTTMEWRLSRTATVMEECRLRYRNWESGVRVNTSEDVDINVQGSRWARDKLIKRWMRKSCQVWLAPGGHLGLQCE